MQEIFRLNYDKSKMTLKTILKNFLNYADTLDAQKKLGKDIYEADFQKLKALTEELKRDKDYNTSEGLKEVNRRKNRYKDILPYDYTRVILSEYPGVPGSDYINANYIKGASGSLAYIASQGPLPNTVVDFWRMIWECEVQVIVMACNEQESGKYKCECYWPTDEEKKQYGNINVEFVKWRQVCPDFLVRTLKACWENEERVICQFHYTTWPDHGVPNSVQPILELVRLIRDCQASEAVPVLIHCSAGCGRTGTICAIDYVWGLMRMGKLTKNFNLYNVIADMRRQRIAMVQTKEQYVLVHKAVSSLFEQQLRVIDSHTYENLDEDGEPLILKELHQQEEDIYEDILDPPFLDESFVSNVDKKIQPLNTFHEYASGNKDVPPIPSKRDPFPENLLNFSKNLYYKPECDRYTSESASHNLNNRKENNEQEINSKEIEFEFDTAYSSRHSQILLKLCREESVKRLISGWNKAVEQTDDKSVTKDVHVENEFHAKCLTSKKIADSVSNEQKTSSFSNQDKRDAACNTHIENIRSTSTHQSQDDHSSSDTTFSKSSSPEDTHAGKLVGKATVIRRPSIAKLKALFEKSSQSNPESSESGRRRTLFRSHSHYVSHTSRQFTLSDSANQHNSSNGETRTSLALKAEVIRPDRSKAHNQSNVESTHSHNTEYVSNTNIYPQQYSANDTIDYVHTSDDNRKSMPKNSLASSTDLSRENTQQISNSEHSINHSNAYESHSNSDELIVNTKIKLKQSLSTSSKKDKPPDLPAKKKPIVPLPQTASSGERSSKEAEVVVPRFVVNMPKETVFTESSNKVANPSLQKELANKSSHQAERPSQEISLIKTSVTNPDWNSDDSLRDYVRRTQDVERHVLHKNQSFSDPEQSGRCIDQTVKQATKPKLSLTDQTYPKLTYSAEKGLDEKVSFSHECTYMNVNSIAQKNIRQIEEKLKTHPRGAIIDLTSRKSYVDDMTSVPDRQYVFRNTSEPVKFLPRQEAKELSSQEKLSAKTEKASKESLVKSVNNAPSSQIVGPKTDSSRKESDNINSKNLLLHSPPPKSKRGHISKSTTKLSSTIPCSEDSNATPSDNKKSTTSNSEKVKSPKVVSSPNYLNTNAPQITTSAPSNATPAADRSDPRYFPVTRQTASDARYECEKRKAEAREAASGRQVAPSYEPLYSSRPLSSVYHKLPLGYEKSKDIKVLKDSKYLHDNKSHYDKEPLYGLQRSTSGPQILPSSDANQNISHSADMNRSYNMYAQIEEDSKMSKSFHNSETYGATPYDTNQSYAIYGTTGQHNMFPPGPPKPPRTFHYDIKNNQENSPDTYNKLDHNVKREGGRYIVSVASPKHSSVQNSALPASNTEYRYDRVPDVGHVANKTYQSQTSYVSPVTNEVHMSRSYPFTNYDRSYYPRPYGKQYYPESVAFRNVQPVHHVANNIYAGPEKSGYPQQNIYGTVKHRNTFSDYENVYDAQVDYMHAMSNSNAKNEHQNIYQSINPNSMAGLQYSQSDASVYAVLQSQKLHGPFAKSSQAPAERDFKNLSENSDSSVPKRVYFDTLQRRNKQHVSWEQRRSHDDMDIRPAPSARLREQIHARRSMVELDNLEISVASDEGYPEKIADSLTSPSSSYAKIPAMKNERLGDASLSKSPGENNESGKEFLKRNSMHVKEPASFGETLSKAFGKLTSFTKFNAKEAQIGSPVPVESSNIGPKIGKQKDKDKHHNFTVQSPSSSKELPSEQWTQV